MKKLIFSALVGAVLVGVTLVRPPASNNEVLAHGSVCSGVASFLQPNFTGGVNQTLSGVVEIELMTAPNAIRVLFELDGQIIGRGINDGANGDHWRMIWDTRYKESGGPYDLVADIVYDSGNSCSVASSDVTVSNPEEVDLNAEITPMHWEGLPNSVAWFNAAAHTQPSTAGGVALPSAELSKYAYVNWSVESRGVITNKDGRGRFSSGPQAGEGKVKARVRYGGSEVRLEATTRVIAPVTDGSAEHSDEEDHGSDETDTGDPGSGSDADSSEGDTSDSSAGLRTVDKSIAGHLRRVIKSDTEVARCAESSLDGGLDGLAGDGRRPSGAEFRNLVGCFAEQNYVVPSVLAPVDPEDVVAVGESSNIEVTGISNLDGDSLTPKKLVLRGRAAPNSNVIVYVFSEPLVLVATAGADGLWEYTLEDPLPSGEHEVYALVDKGDGEYERSSLASFFVGTAEATSENPNGYSLALSSEPTVSANNRSVNVFIAATIGLVVFAAASVSGLVIYRLRHKAEFATSGNMPAETGSADGESLGDPESKL